MKAILTDVTRCIGCFACASACRQANRTGAERPWPWTRGDGLSAETWTTLVRRGDRRWVRRQCRHCLEPACVSACPVAALTRTTTGAVVYDAARCMGCRYCMMACPYGIPKYAWQQTVPTVRKCTFCADRIRRGRPPACTEACPNGTTIFGERTALLAEARGRLRRRERPYLPRIFGETEVGGTCVLYLSDVPLDFLSVSGQPLGDRPLPRATAPALRAVPWVFVGVSAAMSGLYWMIRRRAQRAAEPAEPPR